MKQYPVINIHGTGQKIKQIMQQKNITVRTIQEYLGLATPQSIYPRLFTVVPQKWQKVA